ncbi:MAG: hypothetical protein JAY63_02895 [Candidatus Thiodiazotropha taylori]|nr:hypothetical protein [Candidatus Thiodiazotropha taylori]
MANFQSSVNKLSNQSQFNADCSTFSSKSKLDTNTGLSVKPTAGLNHRTETTEDKLKSMQSPLDSLLSTKDKILYDSSRAETNKTNNPNATVENSVNIDESGVFFGKHCEKALGHLLANSPTFRELYGKINSSEGWTWSIEVNNSFPAAAGTAAEKTIELGFNGRGIIKTYINPNKSDSYTSVNGDKLTPTLERILAHEIGHVIGRIEEGHSHSVTESSYDKAIETENTIMREIDPNAQVRDIHDPLHPSQRPHP